MGKILLSRTEAAAYLGISLRSLDSLLAARELLSRRIGRRRQCRNSLSLNGALYND